MANRAPLANGEIYHCYNRGVDKRIVFEESNDYDRFLSNIFVGNGTKVRLSSLSDTRLQEVLLDTSIDCTTPLVEILAYSLMPNHFHILLKQLKDGGIATFLQSVSTAYTSYFNKKYTRSGSLFAGTYKSKHVTDDRYLKQVISYIVLNPAEILEPRWKEGGANIKNLLDKLQGYRYSSLPELYGMKRPENKIINSDLNIYFDEKVSIDKMIKRAHEYYFEQLPQV